jgi:large subunit ribosomal protein L4
MAKVDVKTLDGKTVGNVDLDDAVFGVEVNEHLLWEAVKLQRAKTRAGTHKVKGRDEVRGGGKKPYKQKGTGNARQGSTRAPHYVGGGSVFGPRPRDYEYGMPKKALAGALRSALSLRAKESKIVVVEKLDLSAPNDKPSTKAVAKALKALGAASALFVDAKNDSFALSTRNLKAAKYLRPEGVNVYDVLDHEVLVLSKGVVEDLTKRLRPEAKVKRAATEGGAA